MSNFYDFQVEDIKTLTKRRRVMLCHQMGLGKTRIAAKAIELWRAPAIVFAKKNDLYTWEDEILKVTKLEPLVYDGKPKERAELRSIWETGDFDVIITHYAHVKEILERISAVFPTVVADEYHLYGLINRKSVTFKMFKLFKSVNMLLLTGTPVRRDPSDLWGPIHLLDRQNYRSFWRFVNQYCVVEEDWLGHKQIRPYAKNPKALRFLLYDKFMIRRTKDEIKEQLPSNKLRRVIVVPMNKEQEKIYKQLDQDMLAQIESAEDEKQLNFVLAKTGAEKVLRLRQLLVSPQLFGGKSLGGAIDNLIETLKQDAQMGEGYAAFIVTPFRDGVNLIAHTIRTRLPYIYPYKIMGGMRDGEAHATVKKFQESEASRVLICTIKSATGFTATAAKVGYFVGAEWSAVDNVQAEDRIHRIGQTEDVILNYYVHKDTVERRVLQVVGDKMLAEKSALGK